VSEIRKIEDTKGVTRSRKSKDRQCNDQTKKTNNDLQKLHSTLKIEQHEPTKIRCSERVCGSCTTCDTHHVTVNLHELRRIKFFPLSNDRNIWFVSLC